MSELNVTSSIVDYLKSTNQDSSFANRQTLATQYGISNYTGSAEQNTQLLGMVQGGGAGNAPAPAPLNSTQTPQTAPGQLNARDLINGPQDNEIAALSAAEGPQTRASVRSTDEIMTSVTETIANAVGQKAPQPTSLVDRFAQLRTETGVAGLEGAMTSLRNEQREIEAILRQRVNNERGKRVSSGVMAGRIGEITRQEQERLDFVMRQQAYINDQLQTTYGIINTIMGFEQTDYQNAVQAYDRKFSEVMSVIGLARSIRAEEMSERDREQEVGRANLQIMYNTIASLSREDFENLDPSITANIRKLEVQAGLPEGFYQALKARAENAEIVSSSNREVGGVAFTDFIMRDADGQLYVETIRRGSTGGTGGGGASGGGSTAPRITYEEWIKTAEASEWLNQRQEAERMSFAPEKRESTLRARYNELYGNVQFEPMQNMTPSRKATFEAAGLLNAPAQVQAFFDSTPNAFKQDYTMGVATGDIDFIPTVQEMNELYMEWQKLTGKSGTSGGSSAGSGRSLGFEVKDPNG